MNRITKQNFAAAVNPVISTTYAGELAQAYISAALLSGKTLSEGLIEIKENVKYKGVLKTLSSAELITSQSCDFTAAGQVTLAERIITPENLMVNLQLCKQPFREDWEAMNTGGLRVDAIIPPNFETFLLLHIAGKIGQDVEYNIWQGNKTGGGTYQSFDGLVTIADVGTFVPAAQKVTTALLKPTLPAEVIECLELVKAALPSQLLFHADLRLYVSPAVASAYIHALGANNYQYQAFVGVKPLNYDGIQMEIANGMSDKRMLCSLRTNLFFGTNLTGDMNEAKVLDMGNLDGSDNVRVVYRFTGATQIAVGEDVVTFKTTA
jgi:hypothetical protein|tara:strand:- start:10329 stop:11294 length:966 start_codon:yes stop_codon:yes gene_type:complete